MDFVLRKWNHNDVPAVARWADNPRIAQNLRNAFPSPYTRKDAQGFVESCILAGEEGALFYAIDIGGQALGSIAVCREGDVYEKTAELGYWLAQPFWGKGIMTRAVCEICKAAFEKWDIERIEAEPFARNTGSCRVLEKAGFTLEGTLRRRVFKNGELMDSRLYSILRG